MPSRAIVALSRSAAAAKRVAAAAIGPGISAMPPFTGRVNLHTEAKGVLVFDRARIKCGLAALPADLDGVLVCLGDMPLVSGRHLDRLIAAFNPLEGRAIVVPTRRGKRGDPVLWAKRFFSEMAQIAGDVGAASDWRARRARRRSRNG